MIAGQPGFFEIVLHFAAIGVGFGVATATVLFLLMTALILSAFLARALGFGEEST